MSIAVGIPEELGVQLDNFNAEQYVKNLEEKKFNGYICITIAGKLGIEDGLIFFEKGAVKISNYTYFKYNAKYKKEQGLERCLNALKAKQGVIDLFSTTDEQTKLIETLKEDEVIEKEIKIKIPKEFSYKFEEELMKKEIKGESAEQILKKYGITSLRATEASKDGFMYRARKEDEDIQKLVKK